MDSALVWWCAVLSALVQPTLQLSTGSSEHYVAAVVEYGAVGNTTTEQALDIIRQNWHNYSVYIQEAAQQNVDIIVFPECGLTTMGLPVARDEIRPFTTHIPAASDVVNPCTSTDATMPEILRNVSCAAREHQMYVVINLSEVFPCSAEETGCPNDGVYYYNTNVVFDRNGTVVARYRKFNLFVEPGFNVTSTAELATFDTDFGVRFGTFICFDLLFRTPALQLIQETGITDIVYSTAWFSELPYLTAVQVQAGWARALDVNLLASGYNNPSNGNSGSGIYAGRNGALDVIMPLRKTNRMLVQTVPKKPQQCNRDPQDNNTGTVDSPLFPPPLPLSEIVTSRYEELRFFQDDFRAYNTVILKSVNGTRRKNTELCHEDFCCHFDVRTQRIGTGGYTYRLGVFNGIRNFAGISVAGVQVCGIIPCINKDEITSCGLAWNNETPAFTTVFKSMHISGDDFLRHHSLQTPSTLDDKILPFPASLFNFNVRPTQAGGQNEVELSTTTHVTKLQGFAIYGRVFSRDARVLNTPNELQSKK